MDLSDWNKSLELAKEITAKITASGIPCAYDTYTMHNGQKGVYLNLLDGEGKTFTSYASGIHENYEAMRISLLRLQKRILGAKKAFAPMKSYSAKLMLEMSNGSYQKGYFEIAVPEKISKKQVMEEIAKAKERFGAKGGTLETLLDCVCETNDWTYRRTAFDIDLELG